MNYITFKKALQIFSSYDYGSAWQRSKNKPTSIDMPISQSNFPGKETSTITENLKEFHSIPMPKSNPTKPKFKLGPDYEKLEELNNEMQELLSTDVEDFGENDGK